MTDYEKEYKTALERAKKLKETCDSTAVIGWCKYIFPELKETEGEKIRKELIDYLKERKSCESYGQYVLRYDRWITWLEKQGEQKPLFTYNDILALQCCMETSKKVQEDKELYEQLQNLHDRLHDAYWFERQSDVDNADKVESKFKIGDWVVYNRTDHSREVMQIYDIRDNRYYFNDNIHFSWSVKECDEKSHLWTIQDAKDGDILAEDSCIFIIQKLCGITAAKIYCTLFNDGDFEDGSTLYFDIDSTKPATKEQCDTLFVRMKEAGYNWDANKKELINL